MDGNPILGLLWIAGAAYVFGTPGFLVVGGIFGLIFLEGAIRKWFRRRSMRRASRPAFADLPPFHQGLQRAPKGVGLMAVTLIAFIQLRNMVYGGVSFAGILARPGDYWPLLALGALCVLGAYWVYAYAPMVLGARDTAARNKAVLRFAVGLAALVYLVSANLPAQLEAQQLDPQPAHMIGAVLFDFAAWLAVVGLARAVFLSWPRGLARGIVQGGIEDEEFQWGDW
jgi:hypothetical protein